MHSNQTVPWQAAALSAVPHLIWNGRWRHPTCLLAKVVFLLATILLCSCSSETPTVEKATTKLSLPEMPATVYHVVIIGGFESDPTAAQIAGTSSRGRGNSGMFQLKGDLEREGIECSFYNWNGSDAGQIKSQDPPGAAKIVADMVEIAATHPTTEFVIVGHSWGGHTMIEVANQLLAEDAEKAKITIRLALTIDPSSLMRGERGKELPENIPRLVNYHTANAFCWGAWQGETRIENINLGDPKNGFIQNGLPKYDSAFDTHAHNSAEWDQKIHADVSQRIVRVVQD